MAFDPKTLTMEAQPAALILDDPWQKKIDALTAIAEKLANQDYANAGNAQQVWQTAVEPPPKTSTQRFYERKMAALGQATSRGPAREQYRMQRRILAGGTGDTAQRDERGNITGYTSADRTPSSTGSGTPGLDRLEEMQSNPLIPKTPASGVKRSWESDYQPMSKISPAMPLTQPEGTRTVPNSGQLLANDPARNKPAQPDAAYAGQVSAFNTNLYRPSDTKSAPATLVAPAPPVTPGLVQKNGWQQQRNVAGLLNKYQTKGTVAQFTPEQLAASIFS